MHNCNHTFYRQLKYEFKKNTHTQYTARVHSAHKLPAIGERRHRRRPVKRPLLIFVPYIPSQGIACRIRMRLWVASAHTREGVTAHASGSQQHNITLALFCAHGPLCECVCVNTGARPFCWALTHTHKKTWMGGIDVCPGALMRRDGTM